MQIQKIHVVNTLVVQMAVAVRAVSLENVAPSAAVTVVAMNQITAVNNRIGQNLRYEHILGCS